MMKVIEVSAKNIAMAIFIVLLSACSGDDKNEPPQDDDVVTVCEDYPTLPMCNSTPRPEFAKFKLGGADSVRWTGQKGCKEIDLRTGTYGDEKLVKIAGTVAAQCEGDTGTFEFVYRLHARYPASEKNWTSAYRPLNEEAAEKLLESCTWDSSPEASSLVGQWWKANNTYAENRFLEYLSPLNFASQLLPFDDDNYEKIAEETIGGIAAIVFRTNDPQWETTSVWMSNDGSDRPLKLVNEMQPANDLYFVEWGIPFTAEIPDSMRELSEVCEVL